MTAVVIENRTIGDVRPPRVPSRADGTLYPYEMIFNGGNDRAYAETPAELVAVLSPGYVSEDPTALEQRIRLAFDVQVRVQALFNSAATDASDVEVSDEQWALLQRPHGERVTITEWRCAVPLVLLTTDYDLPGNEGDHPQPTGEIIWLDPTSNEALLYSLHDCGYIVLASLRDGEAHQRFQLESYAPYNDTTGTGIKLSAEGVELWATDSVVAEARMETTPDAFWRAGLFREVFPAVTHWYGTSAWTGKARLTMELLEAEALDPGRNVFKGTIQYVDENEPPLPWEVIINGDDGWKATVTVPLPPFQPVSNYPLLRLLALTVLSVIEGEIPLDEWIVLTSLIQSGEFHEALPLQDDGLTIIPLVQHEYLDLQPTAPLVGSPRELWLQSMGL